MSGFIHEMLIEGGKHWSLTVHSGIILRMADMNGGANVGMLLYNPFNLLERYNAPDTLKCQHTFKLTKGHCLYSDMGRIFCSVTEDSIGWHDTIGGNSTKALVRQRWGEKTYQSHRNGRTQNGHDSFLVEGAKYGLSRRDLAANVNWFSKVAVDGAGAMSFDASNSAAGASVDLRFEMDTLVLLHTCPHPMNTSPEYPRCVVRVQLEKAAPVGDDDLCRNSYPENRRGFRNTELYRQCTCEGV